jgi:hypothetical protein
MRSLNSIPSYSLTFFIFLLFGAAPEMRGQNDKEAFFEQRVLPILQQNCFICHDDQKKMGGLTLMSRRGLLVGGSRGPAVEPGKPETSLLINAVRQEGEVKMPPGRRLDDALIETLSEWVRRGAEWPADSMVTIDGTAKPNHWAFRPIDRSLPPEVKGEAWVRTPIDRFILARLETERLQPSPEVERATLIRRVSLDLTGLLPSPEEVDEFIRDDQPEAYDRLVERLLGSPHYGERWGRHWLDLARYADSNGYVADGARPIWMYRDWVINALNRDLPYDEFVIEQLAGDLLPKPTTNQIVATGFQRNTMINLEGGVDYEQYRVEAVVDRVSTTGAAFLGLTLGCARCHDHKFDPISQREFYQMYAFFNNIDELTSEKQDDGAQQDDEQQVAERREQRLGPILEFGSSEQYTQRAELRKRILELSKELGSLEQTMFARYHRGELHFTDAQRARLTEDTLEALKMRPENLNRFQKASVLKVLQEIDPTYKEKQAELATLRRQQPTVPATLVMRELSKARPAFVHLSGDFMRRGADVQPGTPSILPPLKSNGVANRLDLAKWLVSRENPLTPRVTVNRIWQRYFGRGLVPTEDDFGTQGTPPSHPELLDWLASEFVDRGWSLKYVHRLIVTSAVYRQSSAHRRDLSAVDPENRLLARQTRLRLEGEIIRDIGLSASGLLTDKIGGPSVFPPQPKGVVPSQKNPRFWVTETGENRFRRGLYTHFWRSTPHPVLMAFDAPGATTSCTRRTRSNTPLQALSLLNDEAFYEFAEGLARRILLEARGDNSERLRHAFALCLARSPSAIEEAQLQALLANEMDSFQSRTDEATAIAANAPAGMDVAEVAAWISVSRVLLNLDEFVTRE